MTERYTLRCTGVGLAARLARKKARLTQADVAYLLGISPVTLGSIEAGRQSFSANYIPQLPASIRPAVIAAVTEALHAEIERLAGMVPR